MGCGGIGGNDGDFPCMALGFNEADAFVKGPQSQREYLDGSYNIQGKGDDRQVMFRQKHSLDLLPVLPGIQHVFKRNLPACYQG